MIEEGVVVDYKGDKALVKIEKKDPDVCKGCTAIGACKPASDERGVVVMVENTPDARRGDKVLITIDTKYLLKSSLIVYIVPLIFFIVGVLLGEIFGGELITWADKDIVAAVLGIIMLLLAFGIIRGYGRKLEEENGHLPKISRIIDY